MNPKAQRRGARFLKPIQTSAASVAVLLAALGCGEEGKERTAAAPRPARASAEAPRALAESSSPNLLLITMDTTRADALGTYGQILKTSPNIDRLAETGVLFEQVVASSPETLPSHSTIFTGKQPYAHGVRANAGYLLSDENHTLAETLTSYGYRTGAEIAALVLRKETQITQGFEHYRGADSPDVELKEVAFLAGAKREVTKQIRVGSDITRKGINFLRRNRGRKFFLWLHYFDPHQPYSAPGAFNSRIPESPYHAEVALADFQIGLVIEEIKRLGLRGTTLVVLTADHGEGLGDHGEGTHSYFVYDTTMRVPLILWGLEGLPEGLRVASLVRTVDVAPTALDLLGLPPLKGIQGVSLRPLLTGKMADLSLIGYGEATRFFATLNMPPLRFVREGWWKYIHKVNPELYDVIADPGELTNLASQQPAVVERLRSRLEELMRTAPPKPDDAEAAVDSQTAAQLAALGYIGEGTSAALRDEVASLELSGEDPVSKVEDTELMAVAQGFLSRGEYEEALERILPLRDRNPDSAYVLGLYSEALVGLERNQEAIPVLRRILDLDPSNVEKGSVLVEVLEDEGKPGKAVELLNRLLERDPCHKRLRLDLGRVLRSQVRYADLMATLADGAERCPDLLSNLNDYAWALATLPRDDLRDGAKAVRVARVVVSKSKSPDPAHLDTLAAALAEAGDFDEAVRVQSEALALLQSLGPPEDVLDGFRQRLEAFRAGRAVRDPEPTPP
jgi:arylsulfatase A-like enzyme/Flp pilus assembly protein TadD